MRVWGGTGLVVYKFSRLVSLGRGRFRYSIGCCYYLQNVDMDGGTGTDSGTGRRGSGAGLRTASDERSGELRKTVKNHESRACERQI